MMQVASRTPLVWAAISAILALVLSPLVTVLLGKPEFSALALLPIIVVVWLATRLSRADMGLVLNGLFFFLSWKLVARRTE
jgi:hypothetical protein